MTYAEIFKRWMKLKDEVQELHEDITQSIDAEGYITDENKNMLRVMRRGCREMSRILLGYID